VTEPLLAPAELDALRDALAAWTPDAVQELLGPVGRAAHERGDLRGVDRVLPPDERLAVLVRLFLLGQPVPSAQAAAALAPLALDAAAALVEQSVGSVRARVEIRPYADTSGGGPWWVVSDFGSDVCPGPLADDHVLGIGTASLTLAQAVIRTSTGRALDLGTGCGVQALHLARHASSVVATDVSARALRMAATTAALSGQSWELRRGSLLAPVAGERFDVVVANPPFVVSPGLRAGDGGYDYRDSGLAGDEVSRRLVSGIGAHLAPEGTASLLANWVIPSDGDWAGRLESWLAGTDCDAWVWQREVVEPGEYVALWLRDAGELPGTPRWAQRYDAWLSWFDAAGVPAIGMGLVTLWRRGSDRPVVVCENVPQAVEQPVGPYLPAWIARQRRLAALDDAGLLGAALRQVPDLVRTTDSLAGPDGWTPARTVLRQSHALRWELEADDAITGLVAACQGTVPLGVLLSLLASSSGASLDEVVGAALPVVRDLVARGFLDFA